MILHSVWLGLSGQHYGVFLYIRLRRIRDFRKKKLIDSELCANLMSRTSVRSADCLTDTVKLSIILVVNIIGGK